MNRVLPDEISLRGVAEPVHENLDTSKGIRVGPEDGSEWPGIFQPNIIDLHRDFILLSTYTPVFL